MPDSLEKANKKLKTCEETSDVQSSSSDFESSLGVRKIKSTRKCLSDCSSSEEEQLVENLPRPPPILPKIIIKPSPGKKKIKLKNITLFSTC